MRYKVDVEVEGGVFAAEDVVVVVAARIKLA